MTLMYLRRKVIMFGKVTIVSRKILLLPLLNFFYVQNTVLMMTNAA